MFVVIEELDCEPVSRRHRCGWPDRSRGRRLLRHSDDGLVWRRYGHALADWRVTSERLAPGARSEPCPGAPGMIGASARL